MPHPSSVAVTSHPASGSRIVRCASGSSSGAGAAAAAATRAVTRPL